MKLFRAQTLGDNSAGTPHRKTYRATIAGLLAGHWGALLLGIVAVAVETGASLLEPWPIKVVLDTVLHAKPLPQPLLQLLAVTLGANAAGILELAAAAVLVIAALGAAASYVEKQCVTALGQQVTHELRCRIYTHAQRLSMAYHDRKRTGDVISTVTADVDSMQSAISESTTATSICERGLSSPPMCN